MPRSLTMPIRLPGCLRLLTCWLTIHGGRYTPEDGGGQDARRTMIEMVPWLPVYDANGDYTTSTTSLSESNYFGLEGMSNPAMILDLQKRMRYNTQIFGNAALTFHLMDGLDLKTQFGIDSHNATYRGYSSISLNNISMPNGWAEYQNWNSLYWQEETYLTYSKVFGDHRINAMAGLSWQERTQRWNKSRTEGFADDFYEDNNMAVGTNPRKSGIKLGTLGYELLFSAFGLYL